jgi:hypothetical protein
MLSSEMSGTGHQMMRLHSPDMNLQCLCCENLKSHMFLHFYAHGTHLVLVIFECSLHDVTSGKCHSSLKLGYVGDFSSVLQKGILSHITWRTAISLLLYITIVVITGLVIDRYRECREILC